MMCYVCAKQGLREEAVTNCVVCGMGLCMEHSIMQELPVRDIVDWGFGEEEIKYPHTMPRFICPDCKLAIDQRTKTRKR